MTMLPTPEERAEYEDASAEPTLDGRFTEMLDHFGQITSRRGFIARIGRLVIGVFGAGVISLLPMDPVAGEADAAICGGIYCGFCGTKCCSAAPCGGGTYGCPPGTNVGSYWTRCCPPGGGGTRYRYQDCCGGSVSCGHCGTCTDGCPQTAWCTGLGAYKCTKIVSLGPGGCPLAPA
jgi:hypothetical protein